ncbi:acyltransferase family protein (plasmid) [Methylocaldum gracile subsp. desertum]|uniref:acyltransferase family protein n=1 Tax=Methylocaldum sp. GT1BW TaxID=3438964 RepID=UPI003D9FCBB7
MSKGYFKLGYIPELDGLRGIAILAVMAFHGNAPFLRGGFIGVDVFFVLSGFLITSLLISEFDRFGTISFKNFYMRRVLRLAPALILLLLVFCLASFALLDTEIAKSNYVDALISLTYLSNWARAFSIHPPDFLAHTWSLSIEEQFYVLWPLILSVLLSGLRKRRHVVLIAVSIALLSWSLRIYLSMKASPPGRLYNGLDTRADALMVGCALGIILSSGLVGEAAKARLQKILVVGAPFSVVCLLAFAVFSRWTSPWMYYGGFFIVELLTVALVLDILMNPQSVIRKILAMRGLVWAGTVSYGLYLWHYPIYRTMSAIGFHNWTVPALGSLLTVIVAALSYYGLERPMLRLKKHFAQPNTGIKPASGTLSGAEAANS